MSNPIEILGWIGSIAFAICGLPQAIKSYKEGHSDGVSWGFLILWNIGEWATMLYVISLWSIPLLVNYLGNALFLFVITYYKLSPRRVKSE